MYLATERVKFSFSDIRYGQIDEVPWCPVLPNIFARFYENLLFVKCHTPDPYYRYFDDTSSVFNYIEGAKILTFNLIPFTGLFGLL